MHENVNNESMPKLYCKRCGEKLRPRGKVLEYDEYAGFPIIDNSPVCKSRSCFMNPDKDDDYDNEW